MTILARLFQIALTCAIACCAAGAAAQAPGFTLRQLAPDLAVDAAMGDADRAQVRRDIGAARERMERFFGTVLSRPQFVACATEACARSERGRGVAAITFGEPSLRLASLRPTVRSLAHEWTHAELAVRLGGDGNLARVPRWFLEGLAMAVSEEPAGNEDDWRTILRFGLPHPSLAELDSRQDWEAAVRKYGPPAVADPRHLRVVYTRAGHEVRQWLGHARREGALQLLEGVRAGQPFGPLYERLGTDR